MRKVSDESKREYALLYALIAALLFLAVAVIIANPGWPLT